MEKIIQIPEWKMKEIENTLRIANNIHHSHKKETCFDRCVCKTLEYAKEALNEPYISNYIPYQTCPKCNGDGDLMRYNSPSLMGTNTLPICDVCNGSKIIPMHVAIPLSTKISTMNYGEDGIGLSSDEISKLIFDKE